MVHTAETTKENEDQLDSDNKTTWNFEQNISINGPSSSHNITIDVIGRTIG